MEQLNYKQNQLCWASTTLANIKKLPRTPFYLYDEKIFSSRFLDLQKKLKKKIRQELQISYALKANPSPIFLNELKRLGGGADVVSLGETKAALKSGIKAKAIVFSGVGKREEELLFALKNKIGSINVESVEEFFALKKLCYDYKLKANIAFRLNPHITTKTHKHISTGHAQAKFGMSKESILYLLPELDQRVKLIGLSIHIGSQILEIKDFEKGFNKLIDVANQVHMPLEFLDFGGGLGVPYKKTDRAIGLEKYGELIQRSLLKLNYPVSRVIIEPGRYLAAPSGLLISQVIRTKEEGSSRFLIIDAGMNDLIRPALYDAHHEVMPFQKNRIKESYTVVGPVCESSDLFLKQALLPVMKDGDFLAICNAGAYGHSMASTYNKRELIREYSVHALRK